MNIGILALQGAVREHRAMLRRLGVKTTDVRAEGDLRGLDGLVVPGGESTVLGKLLVGCGLLEPIARLGRGGLPLFGTCAGLILLSKHINGSDQERLGLMDVWVERNAFGRQAASFEADMAIPVLGKKPFRAIFIRAPFIEKVGRGVDVLLGNGGRTLLARQGSLLACAFHPELASDARLHEYFIKKVAGF
jgi:5'-phosphate synthase pdxT subunit